MRWGKRRQGGQTELNFVGRLGLQAVRLYLPVETSGALFSVGDTHAAQGDGEVCGTAIESPMQVGLKFELMKQEPLAFPQFTTAGPVTRHLGARGNDVTTGIAPDLMEVALAAVSSMSNLLMRRHHMPAVEVYMLCSVCGDPLCVVEAMTATLGMPPIFIAAGLDDLVGADSERLETALNLLHSHCTTDYYPGETHAFHVMLWHEQAVRCWRDSFEFLHKYSRVKA